MNFWINKIHKGDCLEILKQIPSDSVDCIITSPPYWSLRFYLPKDHPEKQKEIGMEPTFQEHIAKILEVTADIKRVMKPTGSFWLNYGDIWAGYSNSTNDYRTEDSKSINGTGKFEKLEQTGGLAQKTGIRAKSMMGLPWRIALAMIDEQGWILRQDIKWIKQIYHAKENKTYGTVMPASVTDRFNNSGEYLFHFVKEPKYYFNLNSVRIPKQVEGVTDLRFGGGFNRMREKSYNIKYPYGTNLPSKRAKETDTKIGMGDVFSAYKYKKNHPIKYGNDGLTQVNKQSGTHKRFSSGTPDEWHEKGKNIPTAWLISSEPSSEEHFARFPTKLVTIPILSSCPENGIVLDPFSGSGTTLEVAQNLKRNWIGIEINDDYIKLAESKLRQEVLI